MKILITLTSLMVLLAGAGGRTSETQIATGFQSVMIESHPKGWGYAHKTVQSDGTITGAHMSGGPKAVRVYESKSKIKPEDMNRLALLAAKLRNSPKKITGSSPDQKVQGYTSVIVRFTDSKTIAVHAKFGKKFDQDDVQAIWDLVHKYNVGAW